MSENISNMAWLRTVSSTWRDAGGGLSFNRNPALTLVKPGNYTDTI